MCCVFLRLLLTQITITLAVDARHFASKPNKRCMPGFDIEWIRELGTSSFAAAPLIADVDADGDLDIVAVTFSGDIHVLSAVDGKPLSGTKWPYVLTESTVHSSPIQYDADQDGMLDIFIFSSQGEILVFSWDGNLLTSYTLSGLSVKRGWYEEVIAAEEQNIHDYILDNPTSDRAYVTVDPHVLATPALVDLNSDGRAEEFIIPVSYFYDPEYYSSPEAFSRLDNGLSYSELEYYLASSLVILNATDLSIISVIHMELTKVNSEYPGYQLFSPTAVDLDGIGGPLVIVTGSSAGHLHVFTTDGADRPGFPIPTDSIHGQVTVEDVNQDGLLDIVMADVSGTVACYDLHGALQWEADISGTSPSGARVADLHDDGKLQVIITSDDGNIWVLDGQTGKVLEGWPFRVRGKFVAAPTIAKVETLSYPVIMALDSKGFLQILGRDNCRHAATLRETSLVPIVSHDLVPANQGLEFLVACRDGAIMCVSQSNKTGQFHDVLEQNLDLYSWPGEIKSSNNFLYGMYGLQVDWTYVKQDQVTSKTFILRVTVVDQRRDRSGYTIHVSIGSVPLATTTVNGPFQSEVVTVPSPDRPMKGHLVVRCVDRHGKVTETSHSVRFYQTVIQDLHWLLVAPSIAMGLLLLFLYGFPADTLLPSYHVKRN